MPSISPFWTPEVLAQKKFGYREWYQEKRWRQVRLFLVAGVFLGTVIGKIGRKRRIANAVYGDHILVTEYDVDKENIPSFEKVWNDQARLTQKADGYVWTKLFKALQRDWEPDSTALAESTPDAEHCPTTNHLLPFKYLQVTLWRTPAAHEKWLRREEVAKIVERLQGACTTVRTFEYSTLADDHIKRQIF